MTNKWAMAIPMVAVGLCIVGLGVFLATQNPRTNTEDGLAWCTLAAGTLMTGAGIRIGMTKAESVGVQLKDIALFAIFFTVFAYVLVVAGYWSLLFLLRK